MRNLRRPSARVSSSLESATSASAAASEPISSRRASQFWRTLSTTSSMRCGWMRPEASRRSSAVAAISRRSGSAAETMTASGVSSTRIEHPVAASSARMLRPSRPMMRPFTSSPGTETERVIVSAAWLPA